MARHILYSRLSDGGVTVCTPFQEPFRYMCGGGGYWNDKPRGFLDELVRRKTCPMLQNGKHISEDAAWAFVKAMQWGGCTTSEAWEVIRLHDCTRGNDGILHEIIDTSDLPDRWFRDAWCRSENGGPVGINLKLARPIQWKFARNAVDAENKRRAESFEELPHLIVNWDAFRTSINNARDEHELRRVWPEGLAA